MPQFVVHFYRTVARSRKGKGKVVPGTGIEPVRTDEGSTDFKSVVSTNFTTRAYGFEEALAMP